MDFSEAYKNIIDLAPDDQSYFSYLFHYNNVLIQTYFAINKNRENPMTIYIVVDSKEKNIQVIRPIVIMRMPYNRFGFDSHWPETTYLEISDLLNDENDSLTSFWNNWLNRMEKLRFSDVIMTNKRETNLVITKLAKIGEYYPHILERITKHEGRRLTSDISKDNKYKIRDWFGENALSELEENGFTVSFTNDIDKQHNIIISSDSEEFEMIN